MRRVVAVVGLLAAHASSASAAESIRANRRWDVLDAPAAGSKGHRRGFEEGAARLGGWSFEFAGVRVDAALLEHFARTDEPLRRALRERLGQAVDVRDFLFFLDDLLWARRRGRIDDAYVPSGRARTAGILLHPDDVFDDDARRYGRRRRWFSVAERPESELWIDGRRARVLGPLWTAAFPQPETEGDHLDALRVENPDFAARLEHLLRQLRLQGADVSINSSVRPRERGYLIYGAFVLSRCRSAKAVRWRIRQLNRMRRHHGLRAAVRWRHPRGWRHTVYNARRMADAYGVVFATRWGALYSDHYDGEAIDFTATRLPRWLALTSYDGTKHRMFDLRDPSEPRDLSLTPRLIAWIEEAYGFDKLERDYPHWNDAR